jgi:DNA-binding PadR family transcriptional regulator
MSRKDKATQRMVQAIIDTTAEGERLYGYPLMKRAKVRPGSGYPILWRLEREGCLTSGWAEPEGNYPRRRYYQMAEGWDPSVLLG